MEKSLTTFIYFCAPFCATGNDSRRSASKCVQTTLRGKSVSHRVCVTTRAHTPRARARTEFFCVNETRETNARAFSLLSLSLSPSLSLARSNTRYLEEVRAPNVTLLCNFNNHILRSSRIRWRMTRILLVAFTALVCRVTSPAIAEENRAELLALTARKKGRHTQKIRGSFHNELVDTPFAFGTGRKLPSTLFPWPLSISRSMLAFDIHVL